MEHNVTQLTLLANEKFYLKYKDKKLYFKVPSFHDFVYSNDLATMLSV